MTATLSKGCTLVLLLSMCLALGAGLLAWGPLVLSDSDPAFGGSGALSGISGLLTALACLPLCGACVYGLQQLLNTGCPEAQSRPWLGFFALAFMMSASAMLYHLAPDHLGWAITQTFGAAASTLLLLAFLAERLDPRFGSRAATTAGAALALAAGGGWLSGELLTGSGDLRPLLLLQALPVLLIPAGALSLPGQRTSRGDWIALLCLYAAARLAERADAVVAAGPVRYGHALMHLLLAIGAGLLAYRAGSVRRPAVSSTGSQRQTSLNTSG